MNIGINQSAYTLRPLADSSQLFRRLKSLISISTKQKNPSQPSDYMCVRDAQRRAENLPQQEVSEQDNQPGRQMFAELLAACSRSGGLTPEAMFESN